jgi:hypothetical protein
VAAAACRACRQKRLWDAGMSDPCRQAALGVTGFEKAHTKIQAEFLYSLYFSETIIQTLRFYYTFSAIESL